MDVVTAKSQDGRPRVVELGIDEIARRGVTDPKVVEEASCGQSDDEGLLSPLSDKRTPNLQDELIKCTVYRVHGKLQKLQSSPALHQQPAPRSRARCSGIRVQQDLKRALWILIHRYKKCSQINSM